MEGGRGDANVTVPFRLGRCFLLPKRTAARLKIYEIGETARTDALSCRPHKKKRWRRRSPSVIVVVKLPHLLVRGYTGKEGSSRKETKLHKRSEVRDEERFKEEGSRSKQREPTLLPKPTPKPN